MQKTLFNSVLWLTCLLVTSCADIKYDGLSILPCFISTTRNLAQEQTQGPIHLTLHCLPERRLPATNKESIAVAPLAEQPATATIKLRLQSQDAQLALSEILQAQSPNLSPEQVQNTLFYHMDDAGYLQVGESRIRPAAAYVEMTSQADEYLDIIFVFSLAHEPMHQSSATFVLNKAFFLSQPVRFSLSQNQLLATSY